MQQPARVAVVGAGVAGLACALALAMRGLKVWLLEAADEPRHAPAHLLVAPNMLRGLVALGVGEDCVRAGFAYHGMDVIDRQGRRLQTVPTERLAGPRFPAALGIRHADLKQALERAALRAGVQLRDGAPVQTVQNQGEGAVLGLSSGETLAADWVLLATGATSPLREACFAHAQPVAAIDQSWWYALVPRPLDLDRPLVALGEPGRRATLVPVRPDQAGLAMVGPRLPARGPTPVEHLRASLAHFAPCLRKLAAHLSDDTPVVTRTPRKGLLGLPWHQGPVLAVGECAHAFPPHFGQAAAQAVEDARVLLELLPAPPGGTTQGPDRTALFNAFQQRRAPYVQQLHEITSTAAGWDLQPHQGTDLGALLQRLSQAVAQPA